jgi:fucose permease
VIVLIALYFSGGNVLCLDLWGRNSGPFMQALHFSFGLGAFVAPLLAAPFLEPATITTLPFQVADANGMGAERGKRYISEDGQNITGLVNTNFETPNNHFLEFTTKSLENISKTSTLIIPEIPAGTIPNLHSVEFNATDGLEANETTVQPVATTHRVPKRKPSKTNASSLGNKNWDNVHVGSLPKEDLIPLSSTFTVSSSTTASVTAIPTTKTTFPFVSPSSESYSKLKQPLLLQPNETTTLAEETNPKPSSLYESTDFTGSFASKNEENDTDYSKSKMVLPIPSTAKSSNQGIMNNTDSEQMKRPLPINNNHSSMNFSGRSSSLVGDSLTGSSTTEGTVLKTSQSFYSQVMATFSYEQSLKTRAYTISKIPEEFLPSVGTEVRSHMKLSTGASEEDQGTQLFTKYTGNSDNEERRMISSTVQPTFLSSSSTLVKTLYVTAPVPVPAALPGGNLLSKHIHHSKPVTYDNDTEVINSLFNIVANRIEQYGFNRVQFTYLMVGLFIFAVSLVFLGFLCHNPRDPKSKQEEGQCTKKISNRALHSLLVTLMAIFFLLYVGLEVTYGQLVLAFAVNSNLQLAQSTGLMIAVVFWGSFAAMRFASIFFSSGFRPIMMLLFNFVFCTLGTVLLSIMSSHTETALWVGTALLGIGLASVFPTGILWIERYIHVTNKVAAAFVVGASLGEMVCPVAVYQLMVNNPAMLMHSGLVINVLCIVTFIALRWLALRLGEKYCVTSSNGYQLASQEEEEDIIDISPTGSVVDLRQSFSSEHRALLNGNPRHGP